jgi:hypothetical protein
MAKTGRYRWALRSGWAVAVIGLGVLMVQDLDTPVTGWVIINLASAVGTGMLLPAINLALRASVPQDHVSRPRWCFSVAPLARPSVWPWATHPRQRAVDAAAPI